MPTKSITPGRLRIAAIRMHSRFQPREATDPKAVLAFRRAGKDHGAPNGWVPEWYTPIGVARFKAPRLVGPIYYVFEGFHRLALARACGLDHLDVNVYRGYSVKEIEALADRSNLKTRAHTPLEEARVYQRKFDAGKTKEQVANELDHRPPDYYWRRAALTHLHPNLQAAVRDKSLRVEYAEVIGDLARRAAADVPFQMFLRDLVAKTPTRVEVFRAAAEAIAAQRKAIGDGSARGQMAFGGSGFDVSKAVAAAQREMERATKTLHVRDVWARAGTALQRVMKIDDREQPPEIVTASIYVRTRIAAINRTLGIDDGGAGAALAGAIAEGSGGGDATIVARPVIKWVGSKTHALPLILPILRRWLAERQGRLIEPFAGSAAVTLALAPARGVLADFLPEVGTLYRQIRDDPSEVHDRLMQTIKAFPPAASKANIDRGKESYLAVRERTEWKGAAAAARMIYLSKLGFNGLWRTNKAGHNNVPHGGFRAPAWPTLADLTAAGNALRHVKIVTGDWQDTLTRVRPKAGDVIYADSPYEGTFDGYGPKWDAATHAKLQEVLYAWSLAGVRCLVSQPDSPAARKRYDRWRIQSLGRAWRVGGRGARRTGGGELLCALEGKL